MKKTYTINLSGKIFHIDEDALEKLQEYINTLKTYYTREEDGNEIMDDIENRIGELFTESLKGQFREVVTLEDVDQAIATMGTPDDIIDEDEQPRTSPSKQAKKLYRNPDDKILGGVAGGMAAYWGISSLLIRICFVLLCCYYGIFIIIYIILWIAVPKAKTTKQKLEMKGESINVSNIERSIKDEYQEIKNGKGAAFMNRIGEGLCEVLTIIGKVLAIIIGVSLFFGGIFMLFAFLSALFLPNLYPWKSGFMEFTYFFTPLNFTLGKIAISFLIGIPIIMIIYMAIKLLFSFKSNNKVIALSAFSCWMLGLVMLIFVGISEGRSWSFKGTRYGESLELSQQDTLVILVDERYKLPENLYIDQDVFRLSSSNMIAPSIKIYSTDDTIPTLRVQFYTQEEKPVYDNMDFNWNYKNDTLRFDNYIKIARQWRAQKVTLSLYLPENKKVLLPPQTSQYLRNLRDFDWKVRSKLNKDQILLIMRDGKLQPLM